MYSDDYNTLSLRVCTSVRPDVQVRKLPMSDTNDFKAIDGDIV